MGLQPSTPIGKRRTALGYSALEFARLLQPQIPNMTELRLYRIETGRGQPTPEEKKVISQYLGCETFELFTAPEKQWGAKQ